MELLDQQSRIEWLQTSGRLAGIRPACFGSYSPRPRPTPFGEPSSWRDRFLRANGERLSGEQALGGGRDVARSGRDTRHKRHTSSQAHGFGSCAPATLP